MANSGNYSNLDSIEDNTTNKTVVILTRRSFLLQIMNDSSTKDLKFRFTLDHEWATLKPTETVSMQIRVNTVYLSGSNIDYRIWNYG